MSEQGIPHLAERLEALFARVPRPEGGPYSSEGAAEELTARGVHVTGAYLSQLRAGRRDNPSAKLLAAVAHLFGVSVEYFFDDDAAYRALAQLDALGAARTTRLRGLLARAENISDDGLDHLLAIVDHVAGLEATRIQDGDR